MRVLVIGSGGREHAIAWKLHQEGGVTIFCAPGNPGIARVGIPLSTPVDDWQALADVAEQHNIDLTFVGPEAPLASGIVDTFVQRGLRVFGPTQAAAMLESSKAFMKTLCRRNGIPTAPFKIFDDAGEAMEYIRNVKRPLVVKADGLAAGKGVIVAATPEAAVAAVQEMMVDRKFGDAGSRVVIEEVLEGEEVSVFALTDGDAVVPWVPARDYKRLREGDRGPNTGGMGAYAPVPWVAPDVLEAIVDEILEPAVWAMAQEGRSYLGLLFAGVMLTADGPQVLEFNVRLGDPEAQVVLPLLESPLSEAAAAALENRVDRYLPRWRKEYAVCVVLAADGYPGAPRAGALITGIEEAAADEGSLVFHAGTTMKDGRLVTSGGRVLDAVGVGSTLEAAAARAYRAADRVQFEGKAFRRDIAGTPLIRSDMSGRSQPAGRGDRRGEDEG
jgi:phosphoribosylamine--glycine ligase